jgi:hypothetical protein
MIDGNPELVTITMLIEHKVFHLLLLLLLDNPLYFYFLFSKYVLFLLEWLIIRVSFMFYWSIFLNIFSLFFPNIFLGVDMDGCPLLHKQTPRSHQSGWVVET